MAEDRPVIIKIETPNPTKKGTVVDVKEDLQGKEEIGIEFDTDKSLLVKHGKVVSFGTAGNPKTI